MNYKVLKYSHQEIAKERRQLSNVKMPKCGPIRCIIDTGKRTKLNRQKYDLLLVLSLLAETICDPHVTTGRREMSTFGNLRYIQSVIPGDKSPSCIFDF